jgi:copper chaperone
LLADSLLPLNREMTTTNLRVTGMTCGHCVAAVEKALRSQPGVRAATVELDAGRAKVEHDEGAIGPEQLIAAVAEEGYSATVAG